MAPKRKLKIVKVPLGKKQEYKAINFPPMPELYLDLIENKEKVKQELRDQMYQPKWDQLEYQHLAVSNEEIYNAGQRFKEDLVEFDTDGSQIADLKFPSKQSSQASKRSSDNSFTSKIIQAGFNKPYSEAVAREDSPHSSLQKFVADDIPQRNKPTLLALTKHGKPKFTKIDESNDTLSPEALSSSSIEDPFANADDFKVISRPASQAGSGSSSPFYQDKYESRASAKDERRNRYEEFARFEQAVDDRREERRDEYEERRYEREERTYDDRRDYKKYDDIHDRYREDHDDRRDRREEDDDVIGAFLAADIPEPKHSQSVYSKSSSSKPYSQTYSSSSSATQSQQSYQHAASSSSVPPQRPSNRPASLEEINRNAASRTGVLNIAQTGKQDEEKNARRTTLLYSFQRLKQLYPQAKIPEFTEYSDVEVMEREYQAQTRHLKLEASVVNYKRFLTAGFGIIEYMVHRFLRLEEISGFASEQMRCMNQYETILYEIGERNQPEIGKGLAPELRLIGVILFNAAVFVIMNMVIKGGGNLAMSKLSENNAPRPQPAGGVSLNGTARPTNTAPQAQPQQARKPMRGPEINLDDL